MKEDTLRIASLRKVGSDCVAKSKNDSLFLNALLNVTHYVLSESTLNLLTNQNEFVASLEPSLSATLPFKTEPKPKIKSKSNKKP